MHPEIINIGRLAIRAYGLMLFLSFILGLLYVRSKAKSKGINPDFTVNLAFIVIISAVLGSRLFYVFYHWSEFSSDLLSIINPFGGGGTIGIAGLNLYGGFICAVLAGVFYIRKKKEPFWETMDLFSPAIALGIFFTRIGCFLNGCCFGNQCDLPWGVHFPHDSIPYSVFGDIAIHPTQLYSSLYGLLLFGLLYFLDRKPHFKGMLFSIFLIVEAFFRFVIEFVRYYEDAMFASFLGMELTYNHIVAVILFIIGGALFFTLKKRSQTTS
jgi:phosphatidylglycerol---prolipoprotein diacylglyceryl transferase